jgi:hypothetical protein
MQELTVTEMKDVSGGGTRIGTVGTGDGDLQSVGRDGAVALGGRVDPGGANGIAAPSSL